MRRCTRASAIRRHSHSQRLHQPIAEWKAAKLMMCGREFPQVRGTLWERMQEGHAMLVSIAKVDTDHPNR